MSLVSFNQFLSLLTCLCLCDHPGDEDCDRPKSSLLHCCIFPVNIVINFISDDILLWHWVGEVSASLMRSTTNTIPAQFNL